MSAINNTAAELTDAEPEPRDDDSTSAPSPVAATAATQKGEIPANGTVLLGTMTADGRAYALVRSGRDEVARVKPGDRIGRHTVAAIEQGQMILMQNGETMRLVIPGS